MKNKQHEVLLQIKKEIMDALEEIGYSPFGFEIIEVRDDYYSFRISGMKTREEEQPDNDESPY